VESLDDARRDEMRELLRLTPSPAAAVPVKTP
jgi:hypothetical protein